MRLFLCRECGSVTSIHQEVRSCLCGLVTATYVNELDIAYTIPTHKAHPFFLNVTRNTMNFIADLEHDSEGSYQFSKLSLPHPHIRKVRGSDRGYKWGRARKRARKAMELRADKGRHAVKTEYETWGKTYSRQDFRDSFYQEAGRRPAVEAGTDSGDKTPPEST